jgi:GT2 family glycosyltransferase
MSEPDSRTSIVVITRDRRDELLGTLARLLQLPERPRVVVVDNASTDGTAKALGVRFPQVEVIEAGANRGAAGRNLGVERVGTPYVAFCDDDSWPRPGALRHAADVFDARPKLGLLCGRSLLGAREVEDPICGVMERSPLVAEPGMPGPPLLGFVACAAVVRREAYRAAGGFVERFRVGGEEELLAVDLTAAGWWVCYDREYVVHHHPSPIRSVTDRRAVVIRNALWAAWLRRSPRGAVRRTWRLAAGWALDRTTARGVAAALAGLPWVLRRRRAVPPHVEAAMELVEA